MVCLAWPSGHRDKRRLQKVSGYYRYNIRVVPRGDRTLLYMQLDSRSETWGDRAAIVFHNNESLLSWVRGNARCQFLETKQPFVSVPEARRLLKAKQAVIVHGCLSMREAILSDAFHDGEEVLWPDLDTLYFLVPAKYGPRYLEYCFDSTDVLTRMLHNRRFLAKKWTCSYSSVFVRRSSITTALHITLGKGRWFKKVIDRGRYENR